MFLLAPWKSVVKFYVLVGYCHFFSFFLISKERFWTRKHLMHITVGLDRIRMIYEYHVPFRPISTKNTKTVCSLQILIFIDFYKHVIRSNGSKHEQMSFIKGTVSLERFSFRWRVWIVLHCNKTIRRIPPPWLDGAGVNSQGKGKWFPG